MLRSSIALDFLLTIIQPAPSPEDVPFASAENALAFPSGEEIPREGPLRFTGGTNTRFTAHTIAISASPERISLHAYSRLTSDEEHVVSINMDGPMKLKNLEIR